MNKLVLRFMFISLAFLLAIFRRVGGSDIFYAVSDCDNLMKDIENELSK